MLSIPLEEFLSWKREQLSKGGDQQSFDFLLDSVGGISSSDLNLSRINSKNNLHLKKNLKYSFQGQRLNLVLILYLVYLERNHKNYYLLN